MTDTHDTGAPTPGTPVDELLRRRRHGNPIEMGGYLLTWSWHQVWWAFPFILLFANWVASHWVNSLALSVTSSMSQTDALWLLGALIANLLLTFWWEYSEFSKVTYQFASVRSLRANARASIAVALILGTFAGGLFVHQGLPWMALIPTLAAIFDAFVSADRGINNATGKSAIEQTEDEIQKRFLEKRHA